MSVASEEKLRVAQLRAVSGAFQIKKKCFRMRRRQRACQGGLSDLAWPKRQRQPDLKIGVTFADGALTVEDDGLAIPPGLIANLFREPVSSEDGLGVGLYHASRQASSAGYSLTLVENRAGRVAFKLADDRQG